MNKYSQILLLLLVATLPPLMLFADDTSDAKDPIGSYAITFKRLPDSYNQTVSMQKQTRDQTLHTDGKILVAGIFQDTAQETITILQPMRRSEAEQIMNDDPAVKAGLYTATLRPFSCYAPGVAETLPRKVVQEVR